MATLISQANNFPCQSTIYSSPAGYVWSEGHRPDSPNLHSKVAMVLLLGLRIRRTCFSRFLKTKILIWLFFSIAAFYMMRFGCDMNQIKILVKSSFLVSRRCSPLPSILKIHQGIGSRFEIHLNELESRPVDYCSSSVGTY